MCLNICPSLYDFVSSVKLSDSHEKAIQGNPPKEMSLFSPR